MPETPATTPRRVVLNAAAWSAPVIAFTSQAPAAAASAQPGLQGIVSVRKSCSSSSGSVLTIDGRGSYPDRGLWIEDATRASTITSASITLYFPTSLGTITWQALNTGSNWSVPSVDASAPRIANLTAYTMRYTGSFTYSSQNQTKVADGQPCFRATISYTACSQSLTLHSLRRVTINGTVEAIERGPIRL